MKTSLLTLVFTVLLMTSAHAQDVTTVNAKSTDISDNLDLRAVASIFGDAKDLEDFERRLNDPKNRISNLDLNNDGRVDYLRIVESVERGTHLIVIQSVLDVDVFQDVATVEVERDANDNVQVQVVGDVYMYGPNYIYEPVYVHRPVIYTTFWVGSYHPYHSPWYWNYYPVYYTYWAPSPVYQYRRNIYTHINHHHHYNYGQYRRSDRAVAMYNGRRSNGYERMNPNRSFTERTQATNRQQLDNTRRTALAGGRTENNVRTGGYKPAATTRTAISRTTEASDSRTVRTSTADSGLRSGTTVRNASDRIQATATQPVTVRNNNVSIRNEGNNVRSSTRSEVNTNRMGSVRGTADVSRESSVPARTFSQNTVRATREVSTPARQMAPQTRQSSTASREVSPSVQRTPSQTRQSAPSIQRSAPAVRSMERSTPARQAPSSAPRQSSAPRSSRG